LRDAFGGDGEVWSDTNIARIYRRVGPSHIRVDADEVTYPLHVILRYRMERGLIDGSIDVAGIPEAWNALSRELLGFTPPSNRVGCLQDIHWAMGLFGYFPSYTYGAVAAAQLFAAATRQDPAIVPALGRGSFAPLMEWVQRHVHAQASLAPTSDAILRAATGAPLSTDAFKAHLTARYLDE
jgi:carboxypeptidase Taq